MQNIKLQHLIYNVHCTSSPGRLSRNGLISNKIVSFDFPVALSTIGAPDIPKNFVQRSEMENMVF